MDNERRRPKLLKSKGILILLILFLLIFALYFGVGYGTKYYMSIFDETKWINYPEKRYLMVEDMLKKNNIKGWAKSDIVRLLGDKNMSQYSDSETNQITYSLGGDFFMEVLAINFNENNKVINYDVYSD